jgi:hypothetical protein
MVSSSSEGFNCDDICLTFPGQDDDVGVCISILEAGDNDNAEGWQTRYVAPDAVSI